MGKKTWISSKLQFGGAMNARLNLNLIMLFSKKIYKEMNLNVNNYL